MIADLLNLYPFLIDGIVQSSPTAALAYATAWLMPGPEAGDDDSAESDIIYALETCLDCFPEIYAEALQRIRDGVDIEQIEHYLIAEVQKRTNFDIEQINDLIHYISPTSFACPLFDEYAGEFGEDHPWFKIASLFRGVDEEGADNTAQETAKALANSLKEAEYESLRLAVLWLFGLTGNTMADYSIYEMSDMGLEYPYWTPEDVEFMIEAHEEAAEIQKMAQQGLALLESDPDLLKTFKRNIRLLERRKRDNNGRITNYRLVWPERAAIDAPGQTAADVELLPIRYDSAA